MAERLVRFSQPFFDRLDQLFPEERSADGAPSAADFLLYVLEQVPAAFLDRVRARHDERIAERDLPKAQ